MMNKIAGVLPTSLLVFVFVFMGACTLPGDSTNAIGNPDTDNRSGIGVSATAEGNGAEAAVVAAPQTGKELAGVHCARCHRLPEPYLLPRETWPIVLNWMGRFLGRPLDDARVRENLIYPDLVPPVLLISDAEFERLSDYFISNAAPQADMLVQRPPTRQLRNFRVVVPDFGMESNNLITLLSVDATAGRLYAGSAKTNEFVSFDLDADRKAGGVKLGGWPMTMQRTARGIRLGTMLQYDEAPLLADASSQLGKVIEIEGLETPQPVARLLIDEQKVLTDVKERDMDGDGLADLIVTTFGEGWGPFGGGFVTLFWQTPTYRQLRAAPDESLRGAFQEQKLLNQAGAIGAVVEDFNQDGRPDFLVLLSQGWQQLALFLNEGDRRFSRRVVAEFPPSFGGMGIEGADFNGDGHLDIVLATGNTELDANRPGLPYRGVRILENNGDLTFTERFFYPMHGATQAQVADFNGDGRLDLVAVSFLPYMKDFTSAKRDNPPETFVYLENRNDWQFAAATLPADVWSRWARVAVGDLNGDGKPDIALGDGTWGPFSQPEEMAKNIELLAGRKAFPALVFLINEHR